MDIYTYTNTLATTSTTATTTANAIATFVGVTTANTYTLIATDTATAPTTVDDTTDSFDSHKTARLLPSLSHYCIVQLFPDDMLREHVDLVVYGGFDPTLLMVLCGRFV